MEAWLLSILVWLAFLGMTVFLVWMMGTLLEVTIEERRRSKNRSEFANRLRGAVKHSQPDWARIADMADLIGVSDHDIILVIRQTLMDITTGLAAEIQEHEALLQGYLEDARKRQPFEAMPVELRVPLEKIRASVGAEEGAFEPLVDQIGELLKVKGRERSRLRFYTAGGFFVGLVGLALWLFDRFN